MKWSFHIFLLFPLLAITQPDLASHSFTRLDQQIDAILKEKNVPGAQLAIVSRDGILWQSNYGYADLEANRPVTDETMFRIGSITKSFVAVSVMMLVEKNQLHLNDELRKLAPELSFSNNWEKSDPVEIVHLLEHTAGFDDMHLMEYATNGEGWTTLEGLQFHPHSKTSRWKPGKFMSYCNSGPAMAAYVVEKKTGQPIENFVDEHIFSPLGMTTSSLLRTETVRQRLSKGYVGPDQIEAPYWHIINRAGGAINSTTSEMAQYVRFFLNRGIVDHQRLLSPTSIQRIETPTSTLAAKAGVKEGYGLHIQTQRYKGQTMYGHGGGMPGFLANMQYIPELGIGYVFFINKSNGAALNAINQAILDCIVSDQHPSLIQSQNTSNHIAIDIDTDITSSLAGYYRTATSRNQLFRFLEWPSNVIRIKDREGQLYLQPLAGEERLLEAVAPSIYRLENANGFSTPVVFVRDEMGKLILQLPNTFGNYSQTNATAVWGTIYIFNVSSLLILSAFVIALFWIPLWLFGRHKIRNVKALAWPLLAAFSIQGFMLLLAIGGGTDSITQFGNETPISYSIYVFSLLAPVFSIISFWTGIKSFESDMHPIARIHSFLVTMACLSITAYFGYWGVLGLKMWVF